jgi:hypothetical protein
VFGRRCHRAIRLIRREPPNGSGNDRFCRRPPGQQWPGDLVSWTKTGIVAIALLGLSCAPASAKDVYLDKIDKHLDDLWNYLDGLCRGGSGGEEATNKACNQRLEVDKIIEKLGCWNIYPATGKNDTSYWKCRR